MSTKPIRQIFVSSVMTGFKDERKAIANIIIKSGNLPRLSEDFLSQKPSRKTIEEEILKSNCYVGIFHQRWGWVPTDNNPENLSVTALEYTLAKKLGIPCLILVSNLEKEPDLKKFLQKIGEFEDGEWLHHYDDFSQLTAITAMWLERHVNNMSTSPANEKEIKQKLRIHNQKFQSLIKDKISSIYEKPEDYDVIFNSIKDKNCWIIGERGIGKSVILKKITEDLEKNHKNVLYLRAEDILNKRDFLNVCTEEFGIPLDKLILTVTENEELYLIVDSIDAIQKNSTVWSSFSVEIKPLQSNPKLHSVLVVRKSDYNAFPNEFKRDWGVEILPRGFSVNQVKKILNNLKILEKIDEKLYPILQIPFYLDLLALLVDKGKLEDFSKITNQYQFLQEHYNRVIRNSEKGAEFAYKKVELLQNIAQKMFTNKSFKISNGSFPSSPEFDSLRSDGVILDNDYYVEFFHQVYFDFIMSLKIIETGEITNFLIGGYEFFLRSTLYFTLAYLHATDIHQFTSYVENILSSSTISFYWKRVTMKFFADRDDIVNEDKNIIEKMLLTDSSLQASFLEYLIENKNASWFKQLEKSLFVSWSKNDLFQHGQALADYVQIAVN